MISQTSFSFEVEKMFSEESEKCFLDCIIEIMKNHLLDEEDVSELITPILKQKIWEESCEKRTVKGKKSEKSSIEDLF